MSSALRLILTGRPWEKRKVALGYTGSIKVVEITYGVNGWHAHSHIVLLFDAPLSDEQRVDLDEWITGRWAAVSLRRGLGAINGHGVDIRQVRTAGEVGQYLMKVEGGWSMGMELVRTDLKRWSPMQLLDQIVQTGDMVFVRLWKEYERATFGRRAIVWSAGLRKRLLGTDVEISDVEAAASEGADLMLLRGQLAAKRWNALTRTGEDAGFLTEFESVGALLLWIADQLGCDVVPIGLPCRS